MAAVVTTRRRVRIPTVGVIRHIVRDELKDQAESKVIDFSQSIATGVSNVPVLTHLTGISQGPGLSDRIGMQIKLSRLYVRWLASYNQAGAASTSTQNIRIMVVLDTMADGAAPVMSGAAAGLFVSTPPEVIAQRNVLTTNRYLVLYDEMTWTNIGYRAIKFGEFNVNLRNYVNYTGTTNNINVVLNNSIHILMYSDAAANVPSFGFQARLWFQDST